MISARGPDAYPFFYMAKAYSMSRALLYLLDLMPVWACSCLTVIFRMNGSGVDVWLV